MNSPKPLPRAVAVAVRPRLLADSLASVLSTHGLRVLLVDVDPHEHFAVAITTPGGPPVSADLVVELANGPAGTAAATARAPFGSPLVQLQGLGAIVDFVRGLVEGSLQVPDRQR